MLRTEKESVVEELTERLKTTDSLIIADYRGLTNAQLAGVRSSLRQHGATFTVVKNSLTRRAAEAAGSESLLALLDGPTAIAFVQADGDPIAVAKALADTARETKVLSLRGGVLAGKPMAAEDVDELAKLPAPDVLKSQLVGVIVAPLTQLLGLLTAPLTDLVGLVDARIEQLGGEHDAPVEPTAVEPEAEAEPEASAEPEVGEPAEDGGEDEPSQDETTQEDEE